MDTASAHVKGIPARTSMRLRGVLARMDWKVVRRSCVAVIVLVALWVYAVVNRYEYLQTREYTEGEYSLLRFDRWRGRLEECVVPGIDGSFRDPSRTEAMCLTYRASTVPADRRRN
jgi:hypothetical protein